MRPRRLKLGIHMDSGQMYHANRNQAAAYSSFSFFSFLSNFQTRHGSSIGSESAWHASGPEFNPHVWHILSWRLGHENISTAILPLQLIQEEQLSVTGEKMCTKYW